MNPTALPDPRLGWPALAAVLIALLARAAKSPSVGSPLARIPVRYRPHVIASLGVLSGILNAVLAGTPWSYAIPAGLVSAAVAILAHGLAGGVNPDPLAPGQIRTTAPPGAKVTVEATLGEPGAPPAPPIEPSQAWGPPPSRDAA